MLRHLRVTNFAILSDVELELGSGMNVLTGETGAGKSLIVEAVNLLRGGRASADIPRAGADEAVVEAIVEVPEDLRARVAGILEAAGLPKADGGGDEVFIRRVILRANSAENVRRRPWPRSRRAAAASSRTGRRASGVASRAVASSAEGTRPSATRSSARSSGLSSSTAMRIPGSA